MILPLILIAAVTLAGAAVAMALRNLIHSALCLVLAWSGIAAFFLWAGAEFAAFAQALVYLGAISMVVLFAVLLTRQRTGPAREALRFHAGRSAAAVLVSGGVAGVMGWAVLGTALPAPPAAGVPVLTVRQLGTQLMGPHAAALLVVGLILTVALIGGVVIAATEAKNQDPP
ncbi:MAG TPA: NADH-quinone oxidoreductase subunit J [Opitutaceae bacterium]|nr:NADH-quinone oxidoreductase subunit J [Opitutaceae bacterium]